MYIYEVISNYSIAFNIGITIVDKLGNEIKRFNSDLKCYDFSDALNAKLSLDNVSRFERLKASFESLRFGGRYIYFSSTGLMYFITPIISDGEIVQSIIAGPILTIEHYEYFELDVLKKYNFNEQDINELETFLEFIPFFLPEKVHSMTELLYFALSAQNSDNSLETPKIHEKYELQSVISSYISSLKSETNNCYTLEKEEEFLNAIARKDKFLAKGLLNEVLGSIFFHSGQDFEVIRSRVLELIVLLSRVAIKGGANLEFIFSQNYKHLKEIYLITNILDITYWLNEIMNNFTDTLFKFDDVKHSQAIYSAIEYMNANYMKKLTLDEVAAHVFLSSAYLSKIFKEETNYNFVTYLNIIRIEQSKKLLRDNSIELSDISNIVGFEDQSYFSRVFKKIVNTSPGKYRQTRK